MTSEHDADSIIALTSAIREQANVLILDLLAEHGITDILPAHGVVLHALFEQSPLPMKMLAEAIGRKKNTVTGLINTLEERGYCRRESDPQDARVQLIVLTAKGEKMRAIQTAISEELIRRVWGELSEPEKSACIQSLRTILNNLKQGVPLL